MQSAKSETTVCLHPVRDPGTQRMPLAYGSAATQVCRACGAWRYDLHGWSAWRPASEWTAAMEVDDER